MKKTIVMKWLSDNNKELIYMIAMAGDVNIQTPAVVYEDLDAWGRLWTDKDLQELYESEYADELNTYTDYVTLKHMLKYKESSREFRYEFTQEHQRIIAEGDRNNFETLTIQDYYPQIIKLVKKCDRCTMPYTPDFLKNNEFYAKNYMHFTPNDCLVIIKSFQPSNFRGCILSDHPDYYGNTIFQFSRKGEFFDSNERAIDEHDLRMEISVRQSLEGSRTVALVSLK